MKLFQSYKYHFGLLFFGLLWLFAFDVVTEMSRQTHIYPDSWSYLESAKNLYLFHRGHNYRPMLMAIITGFPLLFGASDITIFNIAALVNIACWLGFGLILYEIGKQFFSIKKSFLLALSTYFIIGNLALTFHLLTESIFSFWMLTGFYFLIRYEKTEQLNVLGIGLAFFISVTLIKPGAFYFVVLMILFWFKAILKNFKSKSFIWVYCSLFLVAAQMAGLKHQFGNFTLSYIDAVTYYNYIGSKAMALETNQSYSEVNKIRTAEIFTYPCWKQKEVASQDFKYQVTHHPQQLFKAYGQNLIENATFGNICLYDTKIVPNNHWKITFKNILYRISVWQNRIFSVLALLICGITLWSFKRNLTTINLIAVFVLYTLFTSGISSDQWDRFHVITFPFVMLLCALNFQKK